MVEVFVGNSSRIEDATDEAKLFTMVSTYVGSEFGNREIGAFGDGVPLSLLLIDRELPRNEVGG